MLTLATATAPTQALIEDPAGILAILLATLAIIFWLTQHKIVGRLFKVVPALVFCYFVPTALTTLGVIPNESALYDWVKDYVLPASLLLLILSLDVPGIRRLGAKPVIMLLAGTTGVVIGGPISLLICEWWMPGQLPEDVWRGMTALAGSWIGGGANFVALGEIADAPPAMINLMVIPDVFVANVWMAVLLFLAGRQYVVDRWTGADAGAIRDLERRMTAFQERVLRIPSMPDLIIILAFGFVGSWLAYLAGVALDPWVTENAAWLADMVSAKTWKFIIVTALGVGLSFTPARKLEGAGASKLGTVMIYLLVATIGAKADFAEIVKHPELLLMAGIWILCHIVVLLSVGLAIKAPIFFIAVGSQANIGGAASAPVVATAFHPSLAAVGALLAVAGYVLGTYAGLVCMWLLEWAAGASGI